METTDARLILRLASGLEAPTADCLVYGDMNSDGVLSVEDAVLADKEITLWMGDEIGARKEFINKYFETYPGIKSYMDNTIAKAHQDGYVKTIMNRKRVIDELHNSNYMVRSMGERMALNTPIQGSSADILKKAMIEIDKQITEKNLKNCEEVHGTAR